MPQPTTAHFRSWIGEHLSKSVEEVARAAQVVARRHSARGAYRSGATVLVTYREAHEIFERAVQTALGMLKKAQEKTQLPAHELRDVAEVALRQFASDAKAATKPDLLKFAWADPQREAE